LKTVIGWLSKKEKNIQYIYSKHGLKKQERRESPTGQKYCTVSPISG